MAGKRQRRHRGAGTIIRRGPGSFGIRWRENGRRRYLGGFPTRDMAERALAKIRGDLAAGKAGLPPATKNVPTLGELAEPWLDKRKTTHRSGTEDGCRWQKHLKPHFGHLRPDEMTQAGIRAFIEVKRAEGVNPATIRVFVAILSGLFVDLIDRQLALANPCRGLPRATMRLMKPTHDPKTIPFIEKPEDVRRIYMALPEPLNVAYAIGALAGLRTGEVFALRWPHVDLDRRRIHVRESVKGPLKDRDSRVVPLLDALYPVLAGWKLNTGGTGRVIPPMRCDGAKVDKHTPGRALRAVLGPLGLAREGLGWYEATRHTFASQWAMAGRSLRTLQAILGHSSIVITERYAHLMPDTSPRRTSPPSTWIPPREALGT